jgi:Methyltransferase domain
MLIGNKHLYPEAAVPEDESNNAFQVRFSLWADKNGLNVPEYLLPIIHRQTTIAPFRFEQRFAASGAKPPTKELVNSLGPWHYQIDWSGVATRELHHDLRDVWQELDWKVHRYRSSLLVDLAAQLAGPDKTSMSVLDVACHCGILSLEFGEAGFGSVRGVDLRPENIRQAQFLKSTFDCPNVSFDVLNARNLKGNRADIVFCGGLLYHVTFPVELMSDLFAATGELLIFDSLCQNHPFSGFHLYGGRDVGQSLEGDNAIELVPTYRAIIELLKAAGFAEIYEILGDRSDAVPFYKDRSIRTFIAVKPGSKYRQSLTSLAQIPRI